MAASLGNGSVTFGDSTTQSTAATSATTTNVLNATAGASIGAVGTYAQMYNTTFTPVNPGSTIAGSSLQYCGNGGNNGGPSVPQRAFSPTPTGTWRCMGYSFPGSCSCTISSGYTSVFLRIS